jgi:hypothetical protein
MQPSRMTGPGSGVHKYDILTAVAIGGLHGTPTHQVSSLRLIALITARYNWARNELSIGQVEMARLWGVTERTAKREVKRLTGMGLLEVRRAGVRGRVASYRLNLSALETLSRPVWGCVGADFEQRAEGLMAQPSAPGTVVKVDFSGPPRPPETTGGDPRWDAVLRYLAQDQPDAFANWYRRLSLAGAGEGGIEITAPNAFVLSYVTTHLTGPLRAAVGAAFGTDRPMLLRVAP